MLEKDDYIYGIRAVIEAIEAGKEIDKVMVNRDLRRANRPHNAQEPSGGDRHTLGCDI